jgi:hypothetical protein
MASTATASSGPYKLLTVNNAPARAKLLIGRVTNDLKDRYIIEHVGYLSCRSFVHDFCAWLSRVLMVL